MFLALSTISTNRFSGYHVPNIASLVSVKLENHNYLLWRSQFLLVLSAHGMIGFVDGFNVCLDEFVVIFENMNVNEINPLFSSSIQQD